LAGAESLLIVVMGVTGTGKSAVGRQLARRLGVGFVDGDDYHSAGNVAKMRAGVPLSDEDRAPWIEALHGVLVDHRTDGVVLACSALTASIRRHLAGGLPVRWVYLRGDPALLDRRLRERHGHFAGPDLLPSQLATLEPPSAADAVTVDVDQPLDAVITQSLAGVGPS
jgi:gluconokinase